MIILIS